MKYETSAGGIVVRKRGNVWQVLLLKDMNDAWTFPKGLVEKGEDTKDTARREIAEEVGLTDTTYVADIDTIHYMYQRNGLINKTVYYFLFISKGTQKLTPQKEEGIKTVVWMPIAKAQKIIGYAKTNADLLEKAKKILWK